MRLAALALLLACACEEPRRDPCATSRAVMPHDNLRESESDGTAACEDGREHWTRPRAYQPAAETPTPMPLATPHMVCLACHDLQHAAIVPCAPCHEGTQ